MLKLCVMRLYKLNKILSNQRKQWSLQMKSLRLQKRKIYMCLSSLSMLLFVICCIAFGKYHYNQFGLDSQVIQDATTTTDELLIYPKNSFSTSDIRISIMPNSAYVDDSTPIYYTLDGSTPTTDSSRYTNPIKIDSTSELQVIVVRASALQNNVMSKPITKTYFVGKNVNRRFTTKVVSIVTDAENLYDYEKGIFVKGKIYDDWLAANDSTDMANFQIPANYNQRTEDWVRDAHIEVFSSNGNELANLNAGISVAGTATASYPIKSINIKADEQYDIQTKFFNFVEEGSDLDGEEFTNVGTKTNSVRLRNGGNDLHSTLIRQNVCNEIALQSGLKTTSIVTPVVTYINGEYYSLLQAQNNFSRGNLGRMLSLESEYIEKIGETESEIFTTLNPKIDFTTADFNDRKIRNEFESLVDLDEFFLYYALQILIDNTDWPQNNYKVMRYTGAPIEGNPYSDGRIHFLFFGTEIAFKLYDGTPLFDDFFNPTRIKDGTNKKSIITNMMNYEPYKQAFVNQVCDLLATSYTTNNLEHLFNKYYNQIKEEVPYLIDTTDEQLHTLSEELEDRVEDACENACDRILEEYPIYLSEYFDARDPYQLIIESPGLKGVIQCNTVTVDHATVDSFEGTYYRNYPVKITATAQPGYEFSHYLINGEKYTNPAFTVETNMAFTDALHVEAFFEKTTGTYPTISAVSSDDGDWIELTNYYTNDIEIHDLFLSDDKAQLKKYQCPNIRLRYGETIRLVGKSSDNATAYKMGFSLKDMETIYLVDTYGNIIDSYFIPKVTSP